MTSPNYGAIGTMNVGYTRLEEDPQDELGADESSPIRRERSYNIFGIDQSENTSPAHVRQVSFHNENSDRTPPTRHVSFCETREQWNSDAEPGAESPGARVRSSSGVSYQTHSEAEECGEDDAVSVTLCMPESGPRRRGRSLGSFSWHYQTRRRRTRNRHATAVSDSFVNECICCCVIM